MVCYRVGNHIVSRLWLRKINDIKKFLHTVHPILVQNNITSQVKIIRRTCASEKLPVIMQLSSLKFNAIITDGVKFIRDLFEKNGYEIRIAGGAVRDLLCGISPKDLDFATTATPDEMRDMFNKQNIRIINLKGESHGTVTPRIYDNNYEITTLRIDEVTNGRHAAVKFTKNWFQDASRRDLTINAMFLDFDGNVYDYFNGVEDLRNRRVVFVGDPVERIKEDYLRILRYFRFYGKIANSPDSHDEVTLSSIRKTGSGLEIISGERIQAELYKIISGNYGVELLKKMLSLDLGQYIGFPKKCNIEELNRVSECIKKNNFVVEPITILSSLFENEDDVRKFISRLKPSGYHRDLALFIVEQRNKILGKQPVRFYQKLALFSKNFKFTKLAIAEYLKYMGEADTLKEFEEWECVSFPIKGQEIIKRGIMDQQQVGFTRNELLSMWIDSDFTLTTEELSDLIPEIAKKYTPPQGSNLKKKGQKKKDKSGSGIKEMR